MAFVGNFPLRGDPVRGEFTAPVVSFKVMLCFAADSVEGKKTVSDR